MSEESIEDRDTGSETFPVYDYYDLNLNLLNPKFSNYGHLGLGLNNRVSNIGLNTPANLGTNLGLNSLGVTNAQLIQNRLFNDYGDYGLVHNQGYGHHHGGLGHYYCQDIEISAYC